MENKIPEEYFCPKCNTKMMQDLVATMQKDLELPTLQTVLMGLDILGTSGCPGKLLQPIYEWTKTYGKNKNELNEEEQEKLKLIKWQEWARR